MPFYAVGKGRTTGIFTTWTECERVQWLYLQKI